MVSKPSLIPQDSAELQCPIPTTAVQGPVSWRPTTVKWRQFSQFNRHSTIGTRQTQYHQALPLSANDKVRCDFTFADDGNAWWYWVCRVPMVEWRLDCKNLSLDGRRPPWYRPQTSQCLASFPTVLKFSHHTTPNQTEICMVPVWTQTSTGISRHEYGQLMSLSLLRLLVGCLTSQQHASVSQGRICTDNFTCCHTEIEAADQTFHLTQSQYTDTGPTSPSADPVTPGARQGSHWSANF